MLRLSIAILMSALAGCGVGEHVHVTYADVAPRLARSCLACHDHADGERPALRTIDDVRAHAHEMLAAVEEKTMPPGGIDRSGACNTFSGPAPFTENDVELLRAWIDGGMRESDAPPSDSAVGTGEATPAPRFSFRTDVELPLVATAATSTSPDDLHRCYLVHLDRPGDLVGVSVTSAPSLHHAMVFALPPGGEQEARALDARDDAPGWDCPSTSLIEGATLAFAWVPGPSTISFPEGTGVPLGADVVIQLHEHDGAGDVTSDSANRVVSMSLLLDDNVERHVRVTPIALADFVLPPRQESVELEGDVVFPGDASDVIGVMPHLHEAGRSAELSSDTAGADRCVVDAPRFDFAFQEVAFFRDAVRIDAGARLRLRCTWQTSNTTAPTPWGEATNDEMCTVFLFTTPSVH